MAGSGESKHAILTQSLVEAIRPLTEDMKREQAAEFADVKAMLSQVIARLEILEQGAGSSDGAKRAPRATRQTGAARGGAAGAAGATSSPDVGKLVNSMLWSRHQYVTVEAHRTELKALPGVNQAIAEVDAAGRLKGPADSEDRLKGEHRALWSVLSDDTKKRLKNEFTAWKNEQNKKNIEPALEPDAGDA